MESFTTTASTTTSTTTPTATCTCTPHQYLGFWDSLHGWGQTLLVLGGIVVGTATFGTLLFIGRRIVDKIRRLPERE